MPYLTINDSVKESIFRQVNSAATSIFGKRETHNFIPIFFFRSKSICWTKLETPFLSGSSPHPSSARNRLWLLLRQFICLLIFYFI